MKERITKILLLDIILYIIFFIPTNFAKSFDDIYLGWGIVLLSKDIRLLILPLNYLLIEGADKIFWLFFLLVVSCIPTDIATVSRFTFLYELFYLTKIVICVFLGIEIYKKYKRELK